MGNGCSITAKQLAKYIINYCYKNGWPISNLQLQKILYFVWIDFYKLTKRWLFDDVFYAWTFGPVIPSVYFEYCYCGGAKIRPLYEDDRYFGNPSDEDTIKDIVKNYKSITPFGLVEKSHEENHAWKVVYGEGEGRRREIPFDTIIELECNNGS